MKINYKNREVDVADSFEGLNPAQYLRYIELVLMLNMGTISPYEMKCKLLSMLLGLKLDYTLYGSKVSEELNPQVDKMNVFFDIREEGEAIVYEPHIKTGINMLPEYQKWTGPKDMLSDITFGQFVTCLNLLVSIGEAYSSQDEKCLEDNMREIGKTLYTHSEFGHEAKTPLLLNYHAFTFFSSVWELIKTVPIPINGKSIDFRILFQESEENKADDNTGWTGISYEVAASGVFGDIRSVKEANVWDVLIYLYKCRFEQLHSKKTDNENK